MPDPISFRTASTIALLAFALANTTACSFYRVHPVVDEPTSRPWYGKPHVDPIDLTNFTFNDTDTTTAYQQATQPGAYDRELRNRLQSRILHRADAICEQHKGDAFGTASNVNLFLTVLTSALSGSAAVVTGVAQSALAGGASFTNAGDVFHGRLDHTCLWALLAERFTPRQPYSGTVAQRALELQSSRLVNALALQMPRQDLPVAPPEAAVVPSMVASASPREGALTPSTDDNEQAFREAVRITMENHPVAALRLAPDVAHFVGPEAP